MTVSIAQPSSGPFLFLSMQNTADFLIGQGADPEWRALSRLDAIWGTGTWESRLRSIKQGEDNQLLVASDGSMMGATALVMYIQLHATRISVKDSGDIAMDRRQEDDFVCASARLPASMWAHSGEGLGRAVAKLPRPAVAVRPTHGHDQTRNNFCSQVEQKVISFADLGDRARVGKGVQRVAARHKVTTKSREFHFFIFFHLWRRRSAFPPTGETTSQGTFLSCRPAFPQVDEKKIGGKRE